MRLYLPPLRERIEDIHEILNIYTPHSCEEKEVQNKKWSDEAIEYLMEYQWLGNFRELINLVDNMVIFVDVDVFSKEDVLEYLNEPIINGFEKVLTNKMMKFPTLREHVEAALRKTHGNIKAAAWILDVPYTTLFGWINDKYKLDVSKFRKTKSDNRINRNASNTNTAFLSGSTMS